METSIKQEMDWVRNDIMKDINIYRTDKSSKWNEMKWNEGGFIINPKNDNNFGVFLLLFAL